MRGKWAQGLQPRFFCWIIKDRLAASERPGGYSRNHRKVRRQEEIIWLRQQNFTHVVSLLDSPHNLHAYDELELPHAHVPFGRGSDLSARLAEVYRVIVDFLDNPNEKILVHLEEFGDTLAGVLAGYLIYAGLVDEGAQALTIVERLTGRPIGGVGREIVATTLGDKLKRPSR
jgi:hypothetical protein